MQQSWVINLVSCEYDTLNWMDDGKDYPGLSKNPPFVFRVGRPLVVPGRQTPTCWLLALMDELIAAVRRNRFIYVENSTSAAFLMNELYELFDAKFIFIFRDGRDFVRSGMSRGWYKPESMMNRLKTLLRRRFLIATGRDTADTLLIPPAEYKTRFEKIAWRWVAVNRIILNHLASLPDGRVFSFKLEDLDREKLISIHSFLGIDADETLITEMLDVAGSKPNKSLNYDFPPFAEWSVMNRERFGVIAGDLMQMLGYQL